MPVETQIYTQTQVSNEGGPTVYIETYGCQMNEYDTELIKTILKNHQYAITQDEVRADIVMLNTCSVRDNANRKIFNRVHEIRNRRPDRKILVGVLGCMATNFKTQLLDNNKLKIDFIAGPDSYKQLPKLIEAAYETGVKTYDVTLSEFETYSDIYPTRESGVNAWIAIMRGCNNFCSFCVVPFTRGRERSRDSQNIVEEVKRLVANGFSQVTLLGQNVNSYRFEHYDFTDLMQSVSDIPGVRRIRYTSPHPKDFPRKLLQVMAERDNICKQIHIPLQSGNNRILDKMNRTYTREEFFDLIEEVYALMPGIALSTDVIAGFPTETDAEFEDTFDVMRKVEFDQAFIFKYSERPLTLASRRMPDDVPEAVKTERVMRLNALHNMVSLRRNKAEIGSVQEVAIEAEFTKRSQDEFQGRTERNKIVILPRGSYQKGDYILAKITDATRNILKGEQVI